MKPCLFSLHLLHAHWQPVEIVQFQIRLLGLVLYSKTEPRYQSPYTQKLHKLPKALHKEMEHRREILKVAN